MYKSTFTLTKYLETMSAHDLMKTLFFYFVNLHAVAGLHYFNEQILCYDNPSERIKQLKLCYYTCLV